MTTNQTETRPDGGQLSRAPIAPMLLNVDETADAMRVSERKIREMLSTGELQCVYVGSRVLVPVRAIDLFITENITRNGGAA